MDSSKSETRASVASFFTTVVDRVFGSEIPLVETKALNLAQKRANIRAVSVRRGFQAILARGDEMTQRIETYKKQRNHHSEPRTSIDPTEPTETIVLSSAELPSPRRSNLANA